MAGTLGIVGSVVGIGSAINSIFGGGSSAPSSPSFLPAPAAPSSGTPVQVSQAASDQAIASSRQADAQSQSLFDYHTQNYRPLEQQAIQAADAAGSPEEMENQAGKAGATVAQQFGNARATADRNLSMYGVNPNSGAAADMARQSATDEAAATAGAENQARQTERQYGLNAKVGVAELGRGLPATAISGSSVGAQAAGIASNSALNNQGITGVQNANIGNALGAIVNGLGPNGLNVGQYLPQPTPNYDAAAASYDPNASNASTGYGIASDPGYTPAPALMDGFRKGGFVRPPRRRVIDMPHADGYVHGGAVRGPGTGTSDSIPVDIEGRPGALAHGEYVLNARAVRKVGLRRLDRMNLAGLPKGSQMKDGRHLATGGEVKPTTPIDLRTGKPVVGNPYGIADSTPGDPRKVTAGGLGNVHLDLAEQQPGKTNRSINSKGRFADGGNVDVRALNRPPVAISVGRPRYFARPRMAA